MQEPDPRGTIGVVLNGRDACRNAELVALEVDPPVVRLLAAATMADRQPARVVPPGAARLRLEERLVRPVRRDFFERGAGHLPHPGRGGLVAAKWHAYTPSK